MIEDRLKSDIINRLRFYADHIDDVPTRDLEEALREAAEHIETLREMVGIKQGVSLGDIEPEGNG
jgi:hypothetical protein